MAGMQYDIIDFGRIIKKKIKETSRGSLLFFSVKKNNKNNDFFSFIAFYSRAFHAAKTRLSVCIIIHFIYCYRPIKPPCVIVECKGRGTSSTITSAF